MKKPTAMAAGLYRGPIRAVKRHAKGASRYDVFAGRVSSPESFSSSSAPRV